MRTQKGPIVGACSRFECSHCAYITERPCDWYRHCNTKRHKAVCCTVGSQIALGPISHHSDNDIELTCSECGKILGSRTSLWRHKKKCSSSSSSNQITTNNNLVALLASATQALQEAVDVNRKLSDRTPSNNLVIGNNNSININVFLNETCGNAMSIQRFADSLSIALDDLQRDTVSALTNTVIKNLQPLSLHDRPIHCKASSEWYIKDDTSGWQRNTGERLLAAAAFGIQRNWLKEFEREYPRWMENDKLRDMYVKIAGTSSADISERGKESVLKAIGGACMLDYTDRKEK